MKVNLWVLVVASKLVKCVVPHYAALTKKFYLLDKFAKVVRVGYIRVAYFRIDYFRGVFEVSDGRIILPSTPIIKEVAFFAEIE